jgi:hypothetical protein
MIFCEIIICIQNDIWCFKVPQFKTFVCNMLYKSLPQNKSDCYYILFNQPENALIRADT